MVVRLIEEIGHNVGWAHTLAQGLEKNRSANYDIVFLDVGLPDGSGLDIIPQLRQKALPPDIIIITAIGDPDGAEIAINAGVWEYIEKGSSLSTIKLSLARALQFREDRQHALAPALHDKEGLIGSSPVFKTCLDLLGRAAAGTVSVLLTGETGTGKELLATTIHRNSTRVGKPFVVVDCAALPKSLVESTLFGHEKGAFTGANQSSIGLISQADGGTLFLDEVGELPMSVQKMFLRTLQERRFRRVGGTLETSSDFRLISATNRNLDDMVAEGCFREDLLYRLRSFAIPVPPLRERPDDIYTLAFHYVKRICEREDRAPKGFSPGFLEALQANPWPGNVRELVNAVDSAITRAGAEPILYPNHLPSSIRIHAARSMLKNAKEPAEHGEHVFASPKTLPPMREWLNDVRDEAEKHYLEKLITAANGNLENACAMAQLSRQRLYGLLKKHGIPTTRS